MNRATSSISHRLSDLEDRLGIQLVTRSPRLALTSHGAAIVARAVDVQEGLARLDAAIAKIKRGPKHLRIMCSRIIAVTDLPVALNILHEAHPAMTIEIVERNFDDIQFAVLEGECDLGMIGPSEHFDTLIYTPYKTDRLCIAVPTDHQLAQSNKPMYFKDALNYPFISLDNAKHITQFALARAAELQREIKTAATVDDFDTQIELLAQTELGIALALESSVKRAMRYDIPVRAISLHDEWASAQFHCCTRPEDAHPLAQSLIKILTMQRP